MKMDLQITRRSLLALPGLWLVLSSVPAALAHRKGRRRRGDHEDDHDHDEPHERGDHDDYYDYEQAIKARKSGKIKPLREILATVSASFKGRYISIEFKQKKTGAFYFIKLLTAGERYLDITVDARLNRIIKVVGQ